MRWSPLRGAPALTRRGWLGLALLVGLAAAACGTGTNPVDIFQEMHYQQSFKAQEPDRLDVPAEAVPFFPPKARKTGAELFAINCSMCHGQTGRGDGAVLQRFIDKYSYSPALDPDLTSAAVQSLPDDALRGIISGGVVVMPAFGKLLTEEEVGLLVDHIKRGFPPAVALEPTPTPAPTPTPTPEVALAETPTPAPEKPAPETAPDLEQGAQLFVAKGCGGCHTIDGVAGAVGHIGPELNGLATRAGARRSGVTAEQYIRESIEDPTAFVVEGFQPVMPPLRGAMTDEEFEQIVAFLLSLK